MSHEATAAAAGNAAAAAAAAVLQRGNAQPSAETMEQVCSAGATFLNLALKTFHMASPYNVPMDIHNDTHLRTDCLCKAHANWHWQP